MRRPLIRRFALARRDLRDALCPRGPRSPPPSRPPSSFARRASTKSTHDDLVAIRRYADALALDPTLGDAYLGLGALRLRLGDAREAERVFDVALSRVPSLSSRAGRPGRSALGPRLPHRGGRGSRGVRPRGPRPRRATRAGGLVRGRIAPPRAARDVAPHPRAGARTRRLRARARSADHGPRAPDPRGPGRPRRETFRPGSHPPRHRARRSPRRLIAPNRPDPEPHSALRAPLRQQRDALAPRGERGRSAPDPPAIRDRD